MIKNPSIKIQRTKDINLIKSIVTEPTLWKLSGYDYPSENYSPYLGHIWLKATNSENEVVGLFELRRFTGICYDAHPYFLPEHHGTDVTISAGYAAYKYIQKKTEIKQLILTIPQVCIWALKYATKLGFRVIGMVKDGIFYNEQVQNLILFQLEVKS